MIEEYIFVKYQYEWWANSKGELGCMKAQAGGRERYTLYKHRHSVTSARRSTTTTTTTRRTDPQLGDRGRETDREE